MRINCVSAMYIVVESSEELHVSSAWVDFQYYEVDVDESSHSVSVKGRLWTRLAS